MRIVLVRWLRSKFATLSAAFGCLFLLGGCEKDSVRIYEVPTERIIESGEFSSVAEGAIESTVDYGLLWSVPESWETQAVGSMRLASYRSSDGIEIAVSKFPGDVGGDLANINRWRRQLSMPQVTSLKEVEGLATYSVPAGDGQLLRLRPSSDPETQSFNVFWMSYSGETWFFKFSGSAAALNASESNLEHWLQSIEKP